jgi:hypothetical protein
MFALFQRFAIASIANRLVTSVRNEWCPALGIRAEAKISPVFENALNQHRAQAENIRHEFALFD